MSKPREKAARVRPTRPAEPRLEARARVWIELGGCAALGQGRIELLEALEHHGSITQAAQAVGISYRAAWRWIDRANGLAGIPLVLTATGGAHGGGAQLTPAGRAAIAAYRAIEREISLALEKADGVLDTLAEALSKKS